MLSDFENNFSGSVGKIVDFYTILTSRVSFPDEIDRLYNNHN